MALATLSIDIIAKLASLEAGLDKANRLSAKNANDIERRWNAVGATFKGVGALIGGAFATQQVAAFIDRTIDGLDKLNDVADSTGSTVEKISALEDIGARAGTGIDTIEGALVKFNAALKEADGKNGVSLALKQIGLDAEQLKQLDPADALLETSKALATYRDDGDKARLVQDLFGKSVREVGPFLKDLAEAGELNATVTKEQAAEAERFNKQLFAMQKNVVDAARELSGPLLKSLNDIIEQFKTGSKEGKNFFYTIFSAAYDDAQVKRAEQLTEQLFDVNGELAKLRALDQKEPLDFFGRGSVKKLERDAAKIRAELDSIRGPQTGRRPANEGGGIFDYSKRSVGAPAKPAEEAKQTEGQRYLENLQRQIERTQTLSVYEQALLDIQQKRIKGITPQEEREITTKARLVDETLRLKTARDTEVELTTRVAKAQLDNIAALEQGNEQLAREIELLGLDEYGQAAVEKARIRSIRTLKEEERAKKAAAGATDEMLQADDREIEALKRRENLIEQRTQRSLVTKVNQSVDAVSDFSKRAAENIQDEIGDALYDTVTGNFDDILERWGELLLRMATQAQAAQIGKALFGESVGGTGSGLFGELLGSIGGALLGGAPDTSQLPTGDFSRMDRVLYQAAEGIDRVPHDGFIAQLHKDEKVVPARYRDGGGAGVVNNISVKNESSDVQASAQARRNGTGGADIEIMIKRIAKQAVAEDIGAGGQVDRTLRSTYGMGRQTPRRS